MDEDRDRRSAEYARTLADYFAHHSEEALYHASLLTQGYIQEGLGPEEITLLHCEAVEQLLGNEELANLDRLRALGDAHQFLLEVMISYGVRYREYADVLLRRQLEELASSGDADRERAEFLTAIAHEFSTPITVARGGVQRASTLLEDGETQRAATFLGTARSALDRLAQLNADLRHASKGEELDLVLLPHDLGEIISSACTWAAVLAEEKSITLNQQHVATPVMVTCNSDSVLTVLGNLLTNAVTYTPVGGRVSVRVRIDGGHAEVVVEDNGMGIAPEELPHIFDKFYRAPRAREISARGLGIGLAITRQLVLAQGGEIDVDSTPGKGSAFRVRLPLASDTAASQGPPA